MFVVAEGVMLRYSCWGTVDEIGIMPLQVEDGEQEVADVFGIRTSLGNWIER